MEVYKVRADVLWYVVMTEITTDLKEVFLDVSRVEFG